MKNFFDPLGPPPGGFGFPSPQIKNTGPGSFFDGPDMNKSGSGNNGNNNLMMFPSFNSENQGLPTFNSMIGGGAPNFGNPNFNKKNENNQD
jgi:hypothetical protein